MKTLKKTTHNWMSSAKYDIDSARHMFDTRRYIHLIFFRHLAIEKMLKAIVAEAQEKDPPHTHDLYALIQLARLDIPKPHQWRDAERGSFADKIRRTGRGIYRQARQKSSARLAAQVALARIAKEK